MVDQVAADNRVSHRDNMTGTTSIVQRADGSMLEGVVRNVSDGGLGIIGVQDGLAVGDEISLTLVVAGDQRVGCTCVVRHLGDGFYGLEYRSKLEQLEETRIAYCKSCKFQFPPDLKFCGYCGRHLKVTAAMMPREQLEAPKCSCCNTQGTVQSGKIQAGTILPGTGFVDPALNSVRH